MKINQSFAKTLETVLSGIYDLVDIAAGDLSSLV